jgi:hypothetical protein
MEGVWIAPVTAQVITTLREERDVEVAGAADEDVDITRAPKQIA